MGSGIRLGCPNCGFNDTFYLGVGFSYPRIYSSTMEEAKKGRFGKKLYKLLKKHPDAVLDPTLVLTHCPKCHRLGRERDLTAYIPKPGYDRSKEPKKEWSFANPAMDIDYVSPTDFKVDYIILEKYDHRCEKCGTELELIREQELGSRKIPCRKCGEILRVSTDIMWD